MNGGGVANAKKKIENAIFICVKHREYISVKNIINKNDGNSVWIPGDIASFGGSFKIRQAEY